MADGHANATFSDQQTHRAQAGFAQATQALFVISAEHPEQSSSVDHNGIIGTPKQGPNDLTLKLALRGIEGEGPANSRPSPCPVIVLGLRVNPEIPGKAGSTHAPISRHSYSWTCL
jgi:hypothetical protein